MPKIKNIFAVIKQKIIDMPKKTKIISASIAITLIVAILAGSLLPPLLKRGIFPQRLYVDFKSYNVTVGDSYRIYANAEYQDQSIEVVENINCKSANEEILETDGNTIIGKKKGTVELECSYWWKKTKIKVTVHDIENAFKPSDEFLKKEYARYDKIKKEQQKVNLSAISDGQKVYVSWQQVKGAKKYIIYHSVDNENFKKIHETAKVKPYEDKKAKDGKNYYKISALDKKGKELSYKRVGVLNDVISPIKLNADNDGDGLTNKEELKYLTDMDKKDTDGDGINDKKAVELFGSGAPILNKLEDIKKKKVTETGVKVDKENTKKGFKTSDKKVAVEIIGSSTIKDGNLTVLERNESYFESHKGIIGNVNDINFDGQGMKEARITLSYKDEDLNGAKEKDLRIYYINEETKEVEVAKDIKVDTKNKTVSATVKHFSDYAIGNEVIFGNQNVGSIDKNVEMVFAVDTSKKMADNGGIVAAKKLVEKFAVYYKNQVGANSSNFKMGLVTFSQTPEVKVPLTDNAELFKTGTESIEGTEGYSAIADGMMQAKGVFSSSTSSTKKLMLITDGYDENGVPGTELCEIADIYGDKITINTVALGEKADKETLANMAEVSDGIYFELGKSVVDAEVEEIFAKVAKQLWLDSDVSIEEQKAVQKDFWPEKFKGTDLAEAVKSLAETNTNLLTGNFVDSYRDVEIDLEPMDLTFERTYNSDDSDKPGIVGNGWSTNYDTRVSVLPQYGKAKKSFNIRLFPGSSKPIIFTGKSGMVFEYILKDNEVDTVLAEGKEWEKLKFENMVFYVEEGIFKHMGGGAQVKYPSGTVITFKEGTINTGEVKEYISPFGVYDRLIFKNNKFYLIYKDGVNIYDGNNSSSTYGKLLQIADKEGRTQTIEYTSGKVTAVTDQAGRKLTLSYDNTGMLYRIKDDLGRYVEYIRDDDDNLTGVLDQQGNKTTYTYYGWQDNFRMKEIIDPSNATLIKNEYDSYGRLVVQYYNGKARIHKYKDSYGYYYPAAIDPEYDDYGMLASFYIDERGIESKVMYNPLTLSPVKSYDANGNYTSYRYEVMFKDDKFTDITDIKKDDPLSDIDELYEAQMDKGNAKVANIEVDRKGNETRNEIDIYGNTYKMSNAETGEYKTEYASTSSSSYSDYKQYYLLNAVKKITNEVGAVTTYEYDTDKARVKKITDAMGNITEYQYYSGTSTAAEKLGLVKKVIEHRKSASGTMINNFNTTSYEYDANGNINKITDNQGNITTQTRDKAGRLLTLKDAKGYTSKFVYDKLDRVIESYDQKNQVTKTYYDDINKVTRVVDRENNETTYKYDRKDLLKEVIDAAGNKKTYNYDAKGNKISETDSNNNTSYYVYDKLNNIKATIDAKNTTITYGYDEEGNVKTINYPGSVVINMGYTKAGRKQYDEQKYKKVNPDGTYEEETKRIEYSYDKLGNIKTMQNTLTGFPVSYEYDKLGRKIKEIAGVGLLDANSNPIQMTTQYKYDVLKQTEELGKEESFIVTTIVDNKGNEAKTYSNELGQLRKAVTPGGSISRVQYDEIGRVIKEINPRGKEVTYQYDELGRVLKKILPDNTYIEKSYYPEGSVEWEKDAKGNKTSYNYTPTYQVKEITNAQNRKTTYEYNPTGTVKSITDTWGRKTEFEYDVLGRAVKTIDPMGNETKVDYDWDGKILREYSKNDPSKYSEITYDELNRPVITTDRNGAKTYTKYHKSGNISTTTDSLGNTMMFDYDKFGRKIKEILPGDTTVKAGWTEYKYNELGQLKSSENSIGKIEEYDYTMDGKIKETRSYPKSNPEKLIKTTAKYDENGNAIETIDADGNKTEFVYNSKDLLEREIKKAGGKTLETSYKYDAAGNLEKTTDYLGNTVTNIYDELNQKVEVLDPYGKRITKTEYYPEQAMIKTLDALDNTTTSYYNKNNQLEKTIMANGAEISYTYDKEGNIKTQKDAKGYTTKFEYDNMNRITKVVDALNQETKVAYDLNGNMTSLTDGKGNTTTYEYNMIGQPSKRIDPGGKVNGTYIAGKVESYTYREDGSLLTKIDRNGVNHAYEYDIYGRLTKNTAGTKNISYEYDNLSNLTKMVDSTGTTARDYDELGRCIEKTVPTIGKSTYQYDITEGLEIGHVAEKTIDPKGNETLKEYDKAGRLAKVTASGKNTTYDYYDNGATKSINRSSGTQTSYIYNNVNQLTSLKTTKGTATIEEFAYEYDLNGNMNKKVDRKGTTTYIYDELNRIKSVTEPGSKVTGYTYDKAGNRLTQIANGKTTTYTYDERNRLTGTTDGTDTYKFEYDNNGNQLKQKKVVGSNETVLLENIYDEFNQAVETRSNGSVIKNTYNGDGLRVVKDTNGTKTNYLYEGMQVVLETDVSNNETGRNVFGNNLISRTTGGKTYDYAYNGMGEITGLIDEAGSMATRYYYDAFGVQTERTGSVINPYSYKSYQYDEESKLYYLNSRYYDPETARFLTEDTVRGEVGDPLSLNLYTYCHNNPVMMIDPDGHMPQGKGVAVIVDGITQYLPEPAAEQVIKHEEKKRNSGYSEGSKGYGVEQIQKKLKALGYYKGPVDGKFGPKTEAAVIKFQQTWGLKPDGIVGNKTMGQLNSSYNNWKNTEKHNPVKVAAAKKASEVNFNTVRLPNDFTLPNNLSNIPSNYLDSINSDLFPNQKQMAEAGLRGVKRAVKDYGVNLWNLVYNTDEVLLGALKGAINIIYIRNLINDMICRKMLGLPLTEEESMLCASISDKYWDMIESSTVEKYETIAYAFTTFYLDLLAGGALGSLMEARKANLASKLDDVARVDDVAKVDDITGVSKTGTVWDDIKITQPIIENTKIPKSFELTANGEKFWVHPNATKHMVEYTTKTTTHGMPMKSQTLLESFQGSVSGAVNKGIKYDEIMNVGNWELIFSKGRSGDLLPVIKHAVYRP